MERMNYMENELDLQAEADRMIDAVKRVEKVMDSVPLTISTRIREQMTESLLQKVLQKPHNPWSCEGCRREAMLIVSMVFGTLPPDVDIEKIVKERKRLDLSHLPHLARMACGHEQSGA